MGEFLEQAIKRRRLAKHVPLVGSWTLDTQTGLMTGSPELFAIFQMPRTPGGCFPHVLVQSMTVSEDAEAVAAARRYSAATGGRWEVEFTILSGKLEYRRVALVAHPLAGSSHIFFGALAWIGPGAAVNRISEAGGG